MCCPRWPASFVSCGTGHADSTCCCCSVAGHRPARLTGLRLRATPAARRPSAHPQDCRSARSLHQRESRHEHLHSHIYLEPCTKPMQRQACAGSACGAASILRATSLQWCRLFAEGCRDTPKTKYACSATQSRSAQGERGSGVSSTPATERAALPRRATLGAGSVASVQMASSRWP